MKTINFRANIRTDISNNILFVINFSHLVITLEGVELLTARMK